MPDRYEPRPTDDLDMRIRDLLGRAVADAPPAPDLAEGASAARPDTPARRWLLGGVTGLSIAAAIVAIFLFARPDETAEPIIPAIDSASTSTVDGRRVTLVPIPPSMPNSTMVPTPTTAPGTVPATASAAPATPSPATPTIAPPTSAPATPTIRRVTVEAGPDGVTVTGPDGVPVLVTAEPMAAAFVSPDGRTFMQRSDDVRDPAAETVILVHDPLAQDVVELALVDELSGPLRLHDVVELGDGPVLLVETGPGPCAGFEGCDGALWAYRPDGSAITELDRMSVWEAGWSRLHVAANGVAVGTISAEAASGLYSVSLSEQPAITAVELGLEDTYFDCSTCPAQFSIDPSGQFVLWSEYDVDTFEHALRVVSAADRSVDRTIPLIDAEGTCCGDDSGPDLPLFESLTVADVTVGPDLISGRVVINEGGVVEGRPPVEIDLATGLVIERQSGVSTSFGTLIAPDAGG